MAQATTPKANKKSWIGLAVLVLPMLLIAIDGMVLVFALPEITQDLQPTGTQQLWILDIYSLMLAGLLITMASLGDRFGRKRVLLIGAGLFSIASIIGGLSPNPETLIFARALLGVAGSMMMPGTLSLIRNMFLDRDQRRIAMAVWAAMGALGAAAGPIVGGWIIEYFSWHAAFFMNLPVMILLLILAPTLVPESKNPTPGRVDVLSIILSLGGMISLVYGVKTLANDEDTAVALLTVAAGALLLGVFVARQLRLAEPMINVRLFKNKAFSGAVLTNLLSVFAMVGALFALTQYLQLVAGLSIIKAALWLLPQAFVSAIAGFIASALVKKVPTAAIVASGMLITAGGFAMLMALTPTTHPWFVSVALCLVGLGSGIGLTLTNDLIMSSVRPEESGQASAISNSGYELGTSFGIAILGSLLLSFYRSGVEGALPVGLPVQVVEGAEETLATALVFAQELPGELGAQLAAAATDAFTHALAATGGVAMGIMVGLAVFATVMLRGVSAQEDIAEDPQPALEPAS
ncbi:MFS transporter [Corynebacterium pelargi]|uniref:Antiseptic resistance protein n=1 Tax=Corynebacterium pelargi TaxID=1471400 RepID=A0A410W6U7_9CORY|nr:MFS transporter [Corynebacterium pelargi]QAU51685.1 Antiseptic resistance protein [Corynebacterium pelargi]GGG80477.1 MFS transporter [Corynebacterium pelargi]